MATWTDLCRENLYAAGECMRKDCYRSSVSRAYFAAYSAFAQSLTDQHMEFAGDRSGPAHSQVPMMIKYNLAKIQKRDRQRIKQAFNLLYEGRLDADYRPHATVGLDAARNALAEATLVAGRLGVTR